MEENEAKALVIQEDDFILEQIDDSSPMWDLKLKRTVKGKTSSREEFKIEGYGMPLTHALLKIIHYRVANKNKGKILDLKQFMKDYKEVSKELFKILQVK